MMQCPNCKHEIPEASNFCAYCGLSLEREPAAAMTKPLPPPPVARRNQCREILVALALLVLLLAGGAGVVFVLYDGELTIRAQSSGGSDAAPPPNWLTQLASRPIIPGTGLAGIELGMAEDEVVEILGVPSAAHPVELSDGEILHYTMQYYFEEKFLGLYADTTSRNVRSIRLYDSDFNMDGSIPLVHGISIGSSRSELVAAFGNPLRMDAHFTCPESLDPARRATTYVYSGIEFWVCDENDSVYLIDIP